MWIVWSFLQEYKQYPVDNTYNKLNAGCFQSFSVFLSSSAAGSPDIAPQWRGISALNGAWRIWGLAWSDCPAFMTYYWEWGLATLLHVSTPNFFKVNSRNVLNSIYVVTIRHPGTFNLKVLHQPNSPFHTRSVLVEIEMDDPIYAIKTHFRGFQKGATSCCCK